jgi:lipid-A-disaccharide synthase
MQMAGCELRADLVSCAVMGFVQVAKNLPFFRRLLSETVQYIRAHPPDVLVLVDYPGFNLRVAAAAKKLGVPIVYYISPQIWAWRPGRIHKIARLVDKMIVILPFEEELYKKENVDVTYVGHPLLDSIAEAELDEDFLEQIDARDPSSIFGFLPGSRRQEIRVTLPVMIETAKILLKQLPQATFLIPCSSRDNMEFVRAAVTHETIPVRILLGNIYEVAKTSRCCLVASGTATLEVACFLTPLIVVYRTGGVAWIIGRRFLRVPNISLVNILAGREVVPEMLQHRMQPDLLASAMADLCRDGEKRDKMVSDLKRVRERLGAPGASQRAAKAVWELLERRPAQASAAASYQGL